MPFNNRSRLDPSQVSDRRGRGWETCCRWGGGLGLLIMLYICCWAEILATLEIQWLSSRKYR